MKSFRFKKVDPIRFRVGDIVEAQITLTGVPIKKGRTKIVVNLRSLALLTGSFTEVGLFGAHGTDDDVNDDTTALSDSGHRTRQVNDEEADRVNQNHQKKDRV
jgi:hypothetical protein